MLAVLHNWEHWWVVGQFGCIASSLGEEKKADDGYFEFLGDQYQSVLVCRWDLVTLENQLEYGSYFEKLKIADR